MQMAEWTGFNGHCQYLVSRLEFGEAVTNPFAFLGLVDHPLAHLKASLVWANHWHRSTVRLGSSIDVTEKKSLEPKTRIGYYSADFHNHATAYLMAELFEAHDREKFELVAFSFGPDKQDEMRQRVQAAFDRFIDVRQMSDLEVAQLSRELGIDIAVDLKGYTQDSRPGIFVQRAAPVQVNYLGYPGTMAMEAMDYIIGDPMVIPEGAEPYYSEKIVRLPHSYQVNDAKRRISDKNYSKAELGLPEEGFVYCCFNNTYKITPETFDSWMRILKQVQGSVLWLLKDNEEAMNNLRREAQARGVEGSRLVFAPRMELAEHLARHRAADLFLDTLPYNAHTTASDALWAGLPVLTRLGQAFAGRVAASLLRAVVLEELITQDANTYEALAVELANNPQKLQQIKNKLEQNKTGAPLFDAKLFARHLEAAYEKMHERSVKGLPPEHISVAP